MGKDWRSWRFERKHWRRAGFSPRPLRHFSREVLPGGRAEARFQLAERPFPGMPSLTVLACEQMTPELVWRPDFLDHPNGAIGIDQLELSSATPDADAHALSQLAGARCESATTVR